jgi:RNA-directed DNA polymerase
VISPVLANIYLHYVYDLWVHQWRRRHAVGKVIVVRYADDTVVGFPHRSDAERFLDELRQRLQRFGLELHLQKTRIIEFGRLATRKRKARNLGEPEIFAFLGFTHICGTSRAGTFLILRHTVRERLREKLRQVKEAIWRMMHRPVTEQGLYLKRVMNRLPQLLCRSHQQPSDQLVLSPCRLVLVPRAPAAGPDQPADMAAHEALTDLWLPPARIRHPLPDVRFSVMTQGRSRMR